MPINVNAPQLNHNKEQKEKQRDPLDDIAKAVGIAASIYGIKQKGDENDILKGRETRAADEAAIQKQVQEAALAKSKREADEYSGLRVPNSPGFAALKSQYESAGLKVPGGVNTEAGLRTPEMTEAYKTALDTRKGLALKRAETSESDKTAKRSEKEFQNRYASINTEIDALNDMIDKKGTFEAFGAHNKELAQKLDSIAIDSAKLFDPQSVARESEVAAFKNMLFEGGTLTTNNQTAKDILAAYRDQLSRRAEAQGIAVAGKEKAPPFDPDVLAYAKEHGITPEQAKAIKISRSSAIGPKTKTGMK